MKYKVGDWVLVKSKEKLYSFPKSKYGQYQCKNKGLFSYEFIEDKGGTLERIKQVEPAGSYWYYEIKGEYSLNDEVIECKIDSELLKVLYDH